MPGRHLYRRCVGRQKYPRCCPVGARGSAYAHSARHVPPDLYAPSYLDTNTNAHTFAADTHPHADAAQPDITTRSHTRRRSANPCPIPNAHLVAAHANAHTFTADTHPAAANRHASSPVDHL